MMLIDKAQVAQRFAKAHQSYDLHAVVQKRICRHLMNLMLQILPERNFKRVLEIGCGSGSLSHQLLQRLRIERLILNDLYPEIQQHFKAAENLEWLIGDIEQLAFPQALDLAVSSSALQWMADLKSVFRQAHQALQPRGYFCFSTFGQQNLQEIKALTGQGLEYLTPAEIQRLLLQQGFEVLHLSESLDALHFNHPREVLQHLKATGVTAVSAGQRWTKQSLAQFYQGYAQYSQRNDAGQPEYHLSYHPIYCIARRTS